MILVSASFAEGRNPLIIDEIVRRFSRAANITLVEVDPNQEYNLTKVIYGGSVEAVIDATFSLLEAALEQLDLVRSEASQVGILQPIAFIPLNSADIATASEAAAKFSETVAERYRIPVFAFGNRLASHSRVYPADFKPLIAGDTRALTESGDWRPDAGPERFNPHTGIMIVGARYFHLNIALYFDEDKVDMVDEWLASATGQESPNESPEETYRDLLGAVNFVAESTHRDRRMRLLCNVPDYTRVSLPNLFKIAERASLDLSTELIGAELLGFTPSEPLVHAGNYYFSKLYDEQIDNVLRCLMLAVQQLKLNQISVFDIRRQVLEYRLNIMR